MTAQYEDVDVCIDLEFDAPITPRVHVNATYEVSGFVRFDRSGDGVTPNGPPEWFGDFEQKKSTVYHDGRQLDKFLERALNAEFWDHVDEAANTKLNFAQRAIENAMGC